MQLKSKNVKDVLRRNVIDEMNISEKFIHYSITEIEFLGADERLTKAQTLLQEASNLVSDYVDEQIPNCWGGGKLKKSFED